MIDNRPVQRRDRYDLLPVEAIRERDVDMLLLEELSVDLDFCRWITEVSNLPKIEGLNGAWRSVVDFGLGETDILLSYESMRGTTYVLFENKLDASFQDSQASRYYERARKYKEQGACAEARVVLVAPKLYCDNQSDFDVCITYESIADRFNRGDKRSKFKAQLFRIAIEKLRRGYQPVNSDVVQKFWHEYWEYNNAKHPSLSMKEPAIVPHNSDWPSLADRQFTSIAFIHKLAQGNTDATFEKPDENIKAAIKDVLPTWAELVEHKKSFSIRVISEKVDRTEEFSKQIAKVENGLTNIERIRDWLAENRSHLGL